MMTGGTPILGNPQYALDAFGIQPSQIWDEKFTKVPLKSWQDVRETKTNHPLCEKNVGWFMETEEFGKFLG